MKKLIIFLLLAMFFVISCGSSKKTENNDTDILPDEDTTDADENQEDEEKEDEESSVPHENPSAEEPFCDPNPCENLPHSTGRCEFDGDKSYVCHCKDGYFWEDYKCVSPCDPDPCEKIELATECIAKARGEFECSCEKDYFWDGEKCMTPCEGKECQPHSHCHAYSYVTAKCLCDDNFFDWGEECIGPCDPNPCADLSNSPGTCIAEDIISYTCGCNEGYFFGFDQGCVNLCDPNPCSGKENSTDICYQINAANYSCHCKSGYFWSRETESCLEEMPPCSPENNGMCKDYDSGLIWSARAEIKDRPGEIDLLHLDEAVEYCQTARDGGFTDWRLPTIDELRTLVVNCPALEPGGTCKVSEKKHCLSESCYNEDDCSCISEDYDAVFNKFGSEKFRGEYWSSSVGGGFFEGERNWLIQMGGKADLFTFDPLSPYSNSNWDPVRCVRK